MSPHSIELGKELGPDAPLGGCEKARWNAREGQYEGTLRDGLLIWSADGDNWQMADSRGHGIPAAGRRFEAATIALVGGPRGGEEVR